MMNFFKKIINVRKLFLEVVIISVVVGFVAGVTGELFTRAYIFPPAEIESEQILIDELSKEKKEEEGKRKKEAKNVVEETKASLAGIYAKKFSTSQDVLRQIYLPSELKGQGFVLTSDGWILTDEKILIGFSKENLVVSVEGKIFEVEKIVNDKVSGLSFLKVSAEKLAVVKLGDLENLKSSDVVLIMGSDGKVFSTTLQDLSYQPVSQAENLVKSSEEFSDLILLADELDKSYLGSPVVSLSGEVIAVVTKSASQEVNLAIPIDYIKPLVFDILRDIEISRPFLGVKYLDLTEGLGISSEFRQNLDKGALVYRNPLVNTPAAIVGLTVRDIILKVDDEEVGVKNSLTKLIQEYESGDKVELVVSREQKEIKVEVELGELK